MRDYTRVKQPMAKIDEGLVRDKLKNFDFSQIKDDKILKIAADQFAKTAASATGFSPSSDIDEYRKAHETYSKIFEDMAFKKNKQILARDDAEYFGKMFFPGKK